MESEQGLNSDIAQLEPGQHSDNPPETAPAALPATAVEMLDEKPDDFVGGGLAANSNFVANSSVPCSASNSGHGIAKPEVLALDNMATDMNSNESQQQSPGLQIPAGFRVYKKYREGSGKPYTVFDGECSCGAERKMDRRGLMDQFLDKHRDHNGDWTHLTSSDFPWTLGADSKQSRQAEGRAKARRVQADLGPLWKRARSGEWSLLSTPTTWHEAALQAVSNFQQKPAPLAGKVAPGQC
mmetsp:Transcript_36962/g.104324  ORF Transcript_36962/g.104324 Transcript_36962/m.104324 type:complete len:240 (+) Transcript_36962:338-1057(+)